jgi:hypothetical protein
MLLNHIHEFLKSHENKTEPRSSFNNTQVERVIRDSILSIPNNTMSLNETDTDDKTLDRNRKSRELRKSLRIAAESTQGQGNPESLDKNKNIFLQIKNSEELDFIDMNHEHKSGSWGNDVRTTPRYFTNKGNYSPKKVREDLTLNRSFVQFEKRKYEDKNASFIK